MFAQSAVGLRLPKKCVLMSAYFTWLLMSCLAYAIHAERKTAATWKAYAPSPIDELAILSGKEYPFINFDPPLSVRADGSLFLSVAVVDRDIWINMALNSFVSLAKHKNISGLTIMTMGDERLGSVFKRLDLYTYDATKTTTTFPEDFRLEKPLPSWSWGAIIFLRFNAWFEAFRRGIGFCSIDTDVTYNYDVFFAQDHNKRYVDIATQGYVAKSIPRFSNECDYKWVQVYSNRAGFYINPGLSCHAYNDRTLKFMQDFQHHIAVSIDRQIPGWGQPAYHMNFCENEFEYITPNPGEERWHWEGNLNKHNISVSMFTALAPTVPPHPEEPVLPEERQFVPAYHSKACHGKHSGDAVARVKCKEDWLKEQGQWFLPEGLPRGLDAWLNIDDATVAKLKALLHHPQR